jgi:hypothetical protein
LVIRQEGARVVVSFDSRDGRRHDGRSIPLASDAAQAERDIALLAGNVARDQTARFILPPPPVTAAPAASPPASAAPPAPIPPPSPCQVSGPRLPVGVDLAPWVGMSSVGQGRSSRNLSLGLVGALTGGVKGLAASGAVNVDSGPVCGAELAGAVNVGGDVRGAQIAGAVNVANHLAGAQIAGAVNVSADESSGSQIATVNVSAGRLHGVQIGVVNYASDVDFQLGLVNINAAGRFGLDVWANPETGLLLAGVKHGGPHYHWIYALGTRPADPARPWGAIGLGAHITPSKNVYVDLDLVGELQLAFNASRAAELYQARVVVGYKLFPELAVFVGPTYNVLSASTTARTGSPAYATDVADTSTTAYRAWPGIALGVEGL